MGEESNQPQHGNNLELQLVPAVRDPLGQGVQPQEKNAEPDNGDYQNNAHDNHEHVCFTWSSDERWLMVRSSGMKFSHATCLLSKSPSCF
jgi:hypothetical protein